MKSVLLTTTALIAMTGVAAADGHVSVTWSGTATAVAALTAVLEDFGITDESDQEDAYEALANRLLRIPAGPGRDTRFTDSTTDEELAAVVAAARAVLESRTARDEFGVQTGDPDAALDLKQWAGWQATLDAFFGTLATPTGDFEEYAEINATVTGSVALDSGVTVSASMSVDAGRGYDFADDDGFDSQGDQSGSVGFDNVTVDAGAFGTLVINPNDMAHLVDDDDDASVDVMYTNDFGIASVSFALDVDEDTDVAPSAAAWELVADVNNGGGGGASQDSFDDGTGRVDYALPTVEVRNRVNINSERVDLTYTPAIAADVQWSAKVSAPVADIATVYAAIDEEGGYDVGASATVAGVSLKAKVKSEALAVENGDDAEFDISGSYAIAGVTVGAGWNSIEDGDQWRINGSYSMNGITVSASTDEGEDWEITGEYALSDNASLVGGVNYTEDAYVGVSFSFYSKQKS
jgi:hypothetical protein